MLYEDYRRLCRQYGEDVEGLRREVENGLQVAEPVVHGRVILRYPVRWLSWWSSVEERLSMGKELRPASFLDSGLGVPEDFLQWVEDNQSQFSQAKWRGYLWQLLPERSYQEEGFLFASPNLTTVPYLVLHHSPTGFAWGYLGSGPADLALNLLEYFARQKGLVIPRIETYQGGSVSSFAFQYHGKFKNDIVSRIPYNELFILPYDDVEKVIEGYIASYAKEEVLAL